MIKKHVFLMFFVLFLFLLVACAESGDAVATTSNNASENSMPSVTTQSIPDQTAPSSLEYVEKENLSNAGISVSSSSIVSGTLLSIHEERLYRFDLATLVASNTISSSISRVKDQNLIRLYGNKSQNYLLASSQVFIKEDAFEPWEKLMAAFVADTGKKTVQVVSAYGYSGESSLESSFVTGYSIAINLHENGSNYSLASSEKYVTVNGKTMTCLDWFQDHCTQYGFVYTGLEGNQARTLATFRYVGVPHAVAMQQLDYVDVTEYTKFLRYYASAYVVNDPQSGVSWLIDYYPADTENNITTISIPKGAVYTVSGDNIDGFIVAYYMPKT